QNPPTPGHLLPEFQPTHIKQDLSRQRVAITMKTAGGKPDQNISRHNRLGIENSLPFDASDNKASQIIFTVGKITGMLCGLAPDQDTARLTTSRSNSSHNHL